MKKEAKLSARALAELKEGRGEKDLLCSFVTMCYNSCYWSEKSIFYSYLLLWNNVTCYFYSYFSKVTKLLFCYNRQKASDISSAVDF